MGQAYKLANTHYFWIKYKIIPNSIIQHFWLFTNFAGLT